MKNYMGLDLGQAADFSTLVVLEESVAANARERMYNGWHVERFPLKTSYPAIVEKVKKGFDKLRPDVELVADMTGVGRPVIDLLRQAGMPVTPITITGGLHWAPDEDRGFHVPKRDLVSSLRVLFDSGRLKFGKKIPAVQTLVQELLAFKVKITTSANDTYGSWRENEHDDLVLAAALAAWFAETIGNRPRGAQLIGFTKLVPAPKRDALAFMDTDD